MEEQSGYQSFSAPSPISPSSVKWTLPLGECSIGSQGLAAACPPVQGGNLEISTSPEQQGPGGEAQFAALVCSGRLALQLGGGLCT